MNANIFQAYEAAFGAPVPGTWYVVQSLEEMEQEFGLEACKAAFEEAASRGIRGLAYVRAVLSGRSPEVRSDADWLRARYERGKGDVT